MRAAQMVLLVLLLVVIISMACAKPRPVLAFWFKPAPVGWTLPAKYAHCTIRDEVVLENGQSDGQPTIRLDCPDRIVLLDKRTKRKIWEGRW